MTENSSKIQEFYPLTPKLAKTLRVAKLRFWAYLVESLLEPQSVNYPDEIWVWHHGNYQKS